MYRKYFLSFCILLIFKTGLTEAKAQDTLYMTIPAAQKIFMEQNLDLIAARFEIDMASARIVQSRLLNNPEIEIIANAYNPEDNKFLDVSKQTGDYGFRLEQLFTLGGKRQKASRLAKTHYNFTQNSFSDLIRDLLFTLRTNFHSLHYLQESYQKLTNQEEGLKKLTASYDRLQMKQLVTLNDAYRIKSLYYSLLSELTEIENSMENIQTQVRVLLNLTGKTIFVLREESGPGISFPGNITLGELLDSARINRPDLKMSRNNILINEQAYALERSLAIPDLKVGAGYARRDAFVPKATMIDVGLEIPLFNRNQGNIKAAKAGIEQARTERGITELLIDNEVQSNYQKVLNAHKTLLKIDEEYYSDYEELLNKVQENLERQRINLLDFAHFHESYRESLLQFYKLKNEKMHSIEELNYSIGKFIFH